MIVRSCSCHPERMTMALQDSRTRRCTEHESHLIGRSLPGRRPKAQPRTHSIAQEGPEGKDKIRLLNNEYNQVGLKSSGPALMIFVVFVAKQPLLNQQVQYLRAIWISMISGLQRCCSQHMWHAPNPRWFGSHLHPFLRRKCQLIYDKAIGFWSTLSGCPVLT